MKKMTIERAIKLLEEQAEEWYDWPELVEAIRLAVASMQRDIRKPTRIIWDKDHYLVSEPCSNCGNDLTLTYPACYCKYCGQSILWPEETEDEETEDGKID